MKHTLLTASLVLLSTAGLVQCGKEGKSEKVKIGINPKSPIVITGDSKDDQGNDITAPWYNFKVNVTNESDESVTIVGIKVITTLAEAGAEPVEKTFTPGLYNYTDTASGDDCSFFDFGVIAAGATADLAVTGTVAPCIGVTTANFFPSGLNKPEDKNSRNYRYQVQIEILGWFGTLTQQNDRLIKNVTIYTR